MRQVLAKLKQKVIQGNENQINLQVAQLLKKHKKVKLNVGCGTDYKKGWINIDNNSDDNIEASKLDLNWDLRNPLPFPDDSVDFIFNEHFIEHLTVEEGQAAVKDFMRVLKPGGVLRMATPDLEYAVYKYQKVPVEKDPTMKRFKMDYIKTKAERLNVSFRWWGHKWLYDWEELQRRMIDIGIQKKKMTRSKLNKSKHKELQNLETRDESRLIIEITK